MLATPNPDYFVGPFNRRGHSFRLRAVLLCVVATCAVGCGDVRKMLTPIEEREKLGKSSHSESSSNSSPKRETKEPQQREVAIPQTEPEVETVAKDRIHPISQEMEPIKTEMLVDETQPPSFKETDADVPLTLDDNRPFESIATESRVFSDLFDRGRRSLIEDIAANLAKSNRRSEPLEVHATGLDKQESKLMDDDQKAHLTLPEDEIVTQTDEASSAEQSAAQSTSQERTDLTTGELATLDSKPLDSMGNDSIDTQSEVIETVESLDKPNLAKVRASLKTEDSVVGNLSNEPEQAKAASVLEILEDNGQGIQPTTADLAARPSSRLQHLWDLYSDYRIDAIRTSLAQLPADQTGMEEVFLRVLCLHYADDAEGIERLLDRFKPDESVYGKLCRIAHLAATGNTDAAHSMAKALVDETGDARAYALQTMLLGYDSDNRGAHYLAATKAYLNAFPDDLKANAEYANSLKITSHEQAVQFLQVATEKFPESAVLRNYLGHSLLQLNRLLEAKAVYDEAIRIAPDYGNLYFMRGGIAWKLGDAEQFERDTLRAAQLSPDLIQYRKARMEVLLRRGEYQPALSIAQSLVETERKDENLGLLAVALAMAGQYSKSKEVAVEIGDLSKLKIVNWFIRGLELLALGDKHNGADLICQAWSVNALPSLCQKILQSKAAGIEFGYLKADSLIRNGAQTVGTAKFGTVFRIRQRNGSWIEGLFLLNGNLVAGWIEQGSIDQFRF